MTTNNFNQTKQATYSFSTSTANKFFLEDNDNIDVKNTYKMTNEYPPTDEKDVVIKQFCDSKFFQPIIRLIFKVKT